MFGKLGAGIGMRRGAMGASAMILVMRTTSPDEVVYLDGMDLVSEGLTGAYNLSIDWGDGTITTVVDDTSGVDPGMSHTYATPGDYTVQVTGEMPTLVTYWVNDPPPILRVDDFGNLSMQVFSLEACALLESFSSGAATMDACADLTVRDCPVLESVDLTGATFSDHLAKLRIIGNDALTEIVFGASINTPSLGRLRLSANPSAGVSGLRYINISALWDAVNFMVGSAPLSTAEYDATLISWGAQTPQEGIEIDFGGSQYTHGGAAATARASLIADYFWTITDGGSVPSNFIPNGSTAFITSDAKTFRVQN